ncbi:trimeric intracellular cation channel family protein [Sporosarcina sp. CAU 1771]
MAWDVFNWIGTIAFAVSGAIVAMEIKYDLFGVYILGIVTAFGGGALRNLLIGVPTSVLWDQGSLFQGALISITIIFLFANKLLNHWERWGNYFDAVGLAAFAIQGALFAVNLGLPVSAVIVAAVLTGSGGGILRDLLAGRKPLVFKREIYAVWAALAGLLIGVGVFSSDFSLYILLVITAGLRILSLIFKWQLPVGKITTNT